MKKLFTLLATIALLFSACCNTQKTTDTMSSLNQSDIDAAIKAIWAKNSQINPDLVERGVKCVAKLWTAEDGSAEEFIAFCEANYQCTEAERHQLFQTIQRNVEAIYGRYNQISIDLKMPLHVVGDAPYTAIDELFGAIDPFAHFSDDMFASKIAFVVVLNFPSYTLNEKNELGKTWTRNEWAYARLGDLFGARIPGEANQQFADCSTTADNYISNYNIMMGRLRNDTDEQLFADNMALITHWGLRDELKSNYANADGRGFEKQRMIYQIMTRIIDQSIPACVISNADYTWNPYSNEVKDLQGNVVDNTREADVRYQMLYNIYKSAVAMDKYCPAYPTYLQRAFDQQMEVTDKEIEEMFVKFISSPEVAQVAELIKARLGRELEPFDIWYDGFKSRSAISEDELSAKTRSLYPNPAALKADLPNIMQRLGFTAEKANEVCAKIEVDPSLGAGHAWGAMATYDVSRLRTRIAANGMDYKGYNIAVHEFGHNVEQTITVYDVDNYMMCGVPSTAFTEALAFVFQKRDLELLGYKNTNPQATALQSLDIFWGSYEIMGVSLVDIYTWRWLYENPDATMAQLKETIIRNAQEIWNKYYAPVLGHENSTILAVYSHMIDSPLYLPNYPYGHIVESQLEYQFRDKVVGEEVCRIYPIGRLTPNLWMQYAVGQSVSVEPLLNEVAEAIKVLNN
ncbi:MAG: hypothetical protein IKT96_03610 [Paludibacteraceae bacterium]|nr:hypothetical protein [Paludibacteraceae bacterium]